MHFSIIILFYCIVVIKCSGLLLLYRPRDISNDCVFSRHLRYDLSFGMGMSDTITLVFRTLSEVDYECVVEIVTDSNRINIIMVVKYPTTLGVNCANNKDAITVLKKNMCLRLCDLIGERDHLLPYFVTVVNGRVRFRFLSNSSINSDINAHLYQVTATSARPRPKHGCGRHNESSCAVSGDDYCFTSGVVCDGINNCGVQDWFDEKKSECGLPIEKLGYAPVIAVLAAILCAFLAAGHILLRCLPSLANSYFIFNANEDNRLCIKPVYKPPRMCCHNVEEVRKRSLIPVSSSSSNLSETDEESHNIAEQLRSLSITAEPPKVKHLSATVPGLWARINGKLSTKETATKMYGIRRLSRIRYMRRPRREPHYPSQKDDNENHGGEDSKEVSRSY